MWFLEFYLVQLMVLGNMFYKCLNVLCFVSKSFTSSGGVENDLNKKISCGYYTYKVINIGAMRFFHPDESFPFLHSIKHKAQY